MWSTRRMRFPSPTPNVAVLHSPTPSRVKIAACSNGLGKKGTGGVAFMMVGEDQPGTAWATQAIAQGPSHVQLVLEPERHGQAKASETPPGHRPGRFRADARTWSGVCRKNQHSPDRPRIAPLLSGSTQSRGLGTPIVLDPAKSLFLGCGNNLAIKHQRGGTVVIERRNPQDRSHKAPPFFCPVRFKGHQDHNQRDAMVSMPPHGDTDTNARQVIGQVSK